MLEELAVRPRFIDMAGIFRAERNLGHAGGKNEYV